MILFPSELIKKNRVWP